MHIWRKRLSPLNLQQLCLHSSYDVVYPYLKRFKIVPLFLHVGVLKALDPYTKATGKALSTIFLVMCFVSFVDGLQMIDTYGNMKFPAMIVALAAVIMTLILMSHTKIKSKCSRYSMNIHTT